MVPDCETLRFDEEVATVRFVDEVSTPRLALDLLLETLRDGVEAVATLLFCVGTPSFTVRDVTAFEDLFTLFTVRSLLEYATAPLFAVERLRFLSHPPLFILRFGVKLATLSSL